MEYVESIGFVPRKKSGKSSFKPYSKKQVESKRKFLRRRLLIAILPTA
jgi:hypothetical protein